MQLALSQLIEYRRAMRHADMQTWETDTMVLADDQRSWCAAGLLGHEDEAISLQHHWKNSGNAVAGDE